MDQRKLIILVIGILAFVIFVVGFGAPYWNKAGKGNVGLWKSCYDGNCADTAGKDIGDAYKACQAMECLALIAGIAGVVLLILPLLKAEQPSNIKTLTAIAFICAGIFALIGVVVWAVEVNENHLHWAYAFTVIGTAGYFITGSLILFAG